MKMKFLFLLITLIIFFTFPQKSCLAQKEISLPSITIINLLRGKELGHENHNLYTSLRDQWAVTKQAKANATWLWQYSVLEDSKMVDFAKNEMKNQEFGLLFEIDRNYTQKSGVAYRGQGPWYFSDGLLLVSYDSNERIKLIDAAFNKFKSIFGYYPKTVGAWWIGADSLSYMQQKYGITAALRASDQFNLDFYTIWGTPWSIPYLSSKENEGIPAKSWEASSKVVNLQWAARDPASGYSDSTFSLQDYFLKGYDLSYVNYLLNNYLKNSSDNIVIGLENGGDTETFNKFYRTMLMEAKKREENKKIKTLLAKDYAGLFLDRKKTFSEKPYFLLQKFNLDDQTFWYHSSNYRVLVEKIGENVFLSDLRDYSDDVSEDFSILPNSQARLWVGEKYIIDSRLFPDSKKLVATNVKQINLVDKGKDVELYNGGNKLAIFSSNKFQIFSDRIADAYNFSYSSGVVNPLLFIALIYSLYLIFVFSITKNISLLLQDGLIFFTILFLAHPYITYGNTNDLNFLFDKKEQLFFYLFPFSLFGDLKFSLLLFQVMPLLILVLSHTLFGLVLKKNVFKRIYYLIILIYVAVYFHVFYFPLDKTSFLILLLIMFSITSIAIIIGIIALLKTKSKNLLFVSFLIIIFVFIFGLASFYSRSKQIIASFETEALQIVKDKKKNVIYVKQEDYSIKPIYKAVKPFLYENLDLSGHLTGVKWKTVLRPENNILKLSDYKNKLIYIPRYLGADLSEYEINNLKVTKIFDNLQIAIYYAK